MEDKARVRRLLLLYCLTVEDWDKIEAYQNGVCYICGRKQKSGKRLATDHEHKGLGRIRGLLCSACNRLIGRIELDILRAGLADYPVVQILQKIIEYITDPPATRALGREVRTFPGKFGTKRHYEYLAKRKITNALCQTDSGGQDVRPVNNRRKRSRGEAQELSTPAQST